MLNKIQRFEVLDVAQLEPNQIRTFLSRHGASGLYKLWGDKLKELARNPFMLWSLVQICDNFGEDELPNSMGQICRALIDEYIFTKRESDKQPPPTQYDYQRVKKPILSQISYRITCISKTRFQLDSLLEDKLIQWLVRIESEYKRRRHIMPSDWTVNGFLKEIIHNGMLRLEEENQLEFMHELVQQYFAAIYLESSVSEVIDCLQQSDLWRTPVRLLAGLTFNLNQLINLLIPYDVLLATHCADERPNDITNDTTARLVEALASPPKDLFDTWLTEAKEAYKKGLSFASDETLEWALIQANLGGGFDSALFENNEESG